MPPLKDPRAPAVGNKKWQEFIRMEWLFISPEGLLLQFDGSPHRWNGKDVWCLIGAIDDATSKMPYAEFFLAEDTLNCMTVMQRIIEKNGIPFSLYVDCEFIGKTVVIAASFFWSF